ncbi:triple functional domain protein isoform X2 [Drosophila subobscura]|uniref:triple functional domain protein isoform X2 n=1 Tax=Drosophila subobscura TaxID=7241 RepID=UPI00155A6194|nr:triple functional domain protein isoform X2 [Drosophila subobscura]
MKSVKKFLNERMNSVDSADAGGGGAGVAAGGGNATAAQKKTSLDRLKYGEPGAGGGSLDRDSSSGIKGYVSLPNTPLPLSAPIAVGDPSPSPSLADSAQNTPLCTLQEDDATSPPPGGGSATSQKQVEHSPFTFPSVDSPTAGAAAVPVQRKSRRKISLPWFRQSSVSSHGVLARQHTIDTPSSFRFFRQPSSSGFKLGNQEATWVVADYIATSGSNELSVSKGQQVEIIEQPSATEPDFCLVRLNPQHDDAAVQEGLVPVSVLKPPPGSHNKATGSTAAAGGAKANENMQEQGNRSKTDALSSSTKRRGFSGRNWLPLMNRKVEKPPSNKPLVKKPSEKNLRLPQKHAEDLATEQQQQQQQQQPGGSPSTVVPQFPTQHQAPPPPSSGAGAGADYEPDEEAGLEMPPPMKPIQEPHLMANGPPAFTKDVKESSSNLANSGKMDGNPLSEIEQIVRERTEQHESNSRVDVGGGENASTNGHGRSHGSTDNNEESHSAVSDKAAALKKRQCVFAELVSTEESYVQDLQEIVNGYMSEINNTNSDIPMPEDLKGGKMKLVFNNIKDIYEWHRDFFLRALRNCQKSPADLGPLVKRSATKFALYYTYCSNKPLSEYIVSAHYQYFDCIRQKLGHRLDLSNLIIKPVQRITKYELLIKEIIKATEAAGLYKEVPMLQEAYQHMKVVVKTVNDMMVVLRSLQDFDGEITAQGSLLMQGPLNCLVDAGQKQRELQVFLFQQIVIFADIEKAKNQYSSPTFKYRSHIQLNHMQMKELGDCRFQIKSTDPNKIPEVTVVCQASTQERYADWRDMLNKILQQQNDLIFMLSNPLQTKNK